MVPFSSSLSSRKLRFSSRRSRLRPGWIRAGELGSTASIALSAQESSSAGLPKYRQAAASSPTTLPPKGALDAYRSSILRFECRSSRRVAMTASRSFSGRLLGASGRLRRMTCMVRVLAPLTTSPCLAFCLMALPTDRKSTPGCHQKRLSSYVTMHFANFSGTLSAGVKCHCPSFDILAPRSVPSVAVRVALTGERNNFHGRQKAYNATKGARIKIIFLNLDI